MKSVLVSYPDELFERWKKLAEHAETTPARLIRQVTEAAINSLEGQLKEAERLASPEREKAIASLRKFAAIGAGGDKPVSGDEMPEDHPASREKALAALRMLEVINQDAPLEPEDEIDT